MFIVLFEWISSCFTCKILNKKIEFWIYTALHCVLELTEISVRLIDNVLVMSCQCDFCYYFLQSEP